MEAFSGTFISVEGGEGSGKSTLIRELKKELESLGFKVVATREPGGTLFGERVRDLLLGTKNEMKMSPLAELFLFLASRSQQVDEVIKPALARGEIVICDRFNDSTVAYQGIARGLGKEFVENQCQIACQGTFPDLTLFLDIDPSEGFKRRGGAFEKSGMDRIEKESFHFHERVRKGLLSLANDQKNRIRVMDAALSKNEVLNLSLEMLKPILKHKASL